MIDVTSLGRLYRSWRSSLVAGVRTARSPGPSHLDTLLVGEERRAPIITVHDAASHAMAWPGGAFVNAALVALDRQDRA